jgi:hypothetical protein
MDSETEDNSWDLEEEGNQSEDEDLMCMLIIGQSKSGKSYMTKSLLQQFAKPDRPIYIVNETNSNCPYKKIDWPDALKLRNAAVVFEDLIACGRKQFQIIQHMLNRRAHHDKCNPIICICHSLHNNNVYGLLPYVQFIFVAALISSMDSFKTLLSRYGYSKEQQSYYIQLLRSSPSKKYNHFLFDVNRGTIKLTTAGDQEKFDRESEQSLIVNPESSAQKFMGHLEGSINKLRLFDIILPSISKRKLDPKNLTVRLKRKNSKSYVCISLIDYISALTEKDFFPDNKLLKFHKYLTSKKKITLPKTYVKNGMFK